jgi:type II secretory ATPase GspE/PulE/Tfp pilus assembly ATPase PilB-like protein
MPTERIENFTELAQFTLDPVSIRMLPRAFCQRHWVVVLGKVVSGATEPITIGMLNPEDRGLLKDLSLRWSRTIRPVALNLYEVTRALEIGYGGGLGQQQPRPDGVSIPRLVLDARLVSPHATAVQLTEDVLRQAMRLQATDIHIEIYRSDVDVRLRIDGVLRQLQSHISPDNVQGVINRIKVLSGMDITERMITQDGRFRLALVDQKGAEFECDFRVSSVPGPTGEDIVIRVLGGQVGVMSVEELGMTSAQRDQLLALLANPEGLILVTGPTGSGKTTTLYSTLAHLNDGSRKILTAENPVEYELAKINQKQTGPNISMADLARAFLRQDPDVILVGEIRDKETADVAIRAAATGHVVLSTLHTADSLGAIHRLRGLSLEADQIAESLLGVVAQRLIRRICPGCIGPDEITELHRRRLGSLLEGIEPKKGAGCRACSNTGYRGRIGIFELLVIGVDMQDEIAEGMHIHELRERLAGEGFYSLVDDALDKVRAGTSTLDELLRVLPYRYLKSAVDRAEARAVEARK